MNTIPEVISRAGIFKPGDVYIFCRYEDREYEPDPIVDLFTVACEGDILTGLEVFHYLGEEELLEIVACETVSALCFKIVMRIVADGEEEEQKVWLHRLLTAKERITGVYESYEKK
ncbi:MAG TPA: hypothetical protein VGM30_19705 [Puia sp.]